jgi:hypothetical protein
MGGRDLLLRTFLGVYELWRGWRLEGKAMSSEGAAFLVRLRWDGMTRVCDPSAVYWCGSGGVAGVYPGRAFFLLSTVHRVIKIERENNRRIVSVTID